jgi:hypothetical protein
MTMIIDGTNGITFPDTSKQYNSYYNFKNRIINGAMGIDQRNAGASKTITDTGANTYTLDRWFAYGNNASKFSVQQNAGSVTPPAGFANYLGVTSLAATTVASGDQYIIGQAVEGFNAADLAWGTASAATITISFRVYSSLTGTFGGAVRNSAGNRSYPFTYTITAANTWEFETITIAGDTSGTWLTNNGVGLYLYLGLGVGSTYLGTAGAWAAATLTSATGATNVVATNGATFYITGVQLEKGTQATSFDYRAYGTELELCQRYYAKSYNQSTVPGSNAGTSNSVQALNGTDGNQVQGFRTPVTMRASATARVWTLSGTLASLSTTSEVNSGINNGSWSPYGMGDQGCRAIVGTGGLSSGVAYVYHWDASAEL